MRALVYDRFGGPEVLHFAEIGPLRPASGEVLVRIHVAGLNFTDVYRRQGN